MMLPLSPSGEEANEDARGKAGNSSSELRSMNAWRSGCLFEAKLLSFFGEARTRGPLDPEDSDPEEWDPEERRRLVAEDGLQEQLIVKQWYFNTTQHQKVELYTASTKCGMMQCLRPQVLIVVMTSSKGSPHWPISWDFGKHIHVAL